MNELLILTLAIILICNLGVLYLYWRIERWMQTPNDIFGIVVSIDRTLRKFIRDTDYDFRALKTRERNQEKAHQSQKRRMRVDA